MGDAAVEDVRPVHPVAHGMDTAPHLRDHPAGDRPATDQRLQLVGGRLVDQAVRIVDIAAQALDVGEIHQLLGTEKLADPLRVPRAAVGHFVGIRSAVDEKSPQPAAETATGTLSERIKASVSVYDFVGRYVELSPTGRGLCPFHDDRRASFSVNIAENYWYCFAGCGGGSVIDFWMKWRDQSFKRSLAELGAMLLVGERGDG